MFVVPLVKVNMLSHFTHTILEETFLAPQKTIEELSTDLEIQFATFYDDVKSLVENDDCSPMEAIILMEATILWTSERGMGKPDISRPLDKEKPPHVGCATSRRGNAPYAVAATPLTHLTMFGSIGYITA
jgi:hypothetical protein